VAVAAGVTAVGEVVVVMEGMEDMEGVKPLPLPALLRLIML
jgi:hypothetical protein